MSFRPRLRPAPRVALRMLPSIELPFRGSLFLARAHWEAIAPATASARLLLIGMGRAGGVEIAYQGELSKHEMKMLTRQILDCLGEIDGIRVTGVVWRRR